MTMRMTAERKIEMVVMQKTREILESSLRLIISHTLLILKKKLPLRSLFQRNHKSDQLCESVLQFHYNQLC